MLTPDEVLEAWTSDAIRIALGGDHQLVVALREAIRQRNSYKNLLDLANSELTEWDDKLAIATEALKWYSDGYHLFGEMARDALAKIKEMK